MTFYERYAAIAEKNGLDPCSKKTADMVGSTKATISKWKTKNITPMGETVAAIADTMGTSTDYLLGRTEDPTDYAKGGSPKAAAEGGTDATPVKKIYSYPIENGDNLMTLISKLDSADRLRAEGVIQGMLMQEKYLFGQMPNAAHVRTDTEITQEMIEHDEAIMSDDDF